MTEEEISPYSTGMGSELISGSKSKSILCKIAILCYAVLLVAFIALLVVSIINDDKQSKDIEERNEEIKNITDKYNKCENQQRQKDIEIKELKEELKKSQEIIRKLELKVEEQIEQIKYLGYELGASNMENFRLRKKNDELKDENAELKSKLNNTYSELKRWKFNAGIITLVGAGVSIYEGIWLYFTLNKVKELQNEITDLKNKLQTCDSSLKTCNDNYKDCVKSKDICMSDLGKCDNNLNNCIEQRAKCQGDFENCKIERDMYKHDSDILIGNSPDVMPKARDGLALIKRDNGLKLEECYNSTKLGKYNQKEFMEKCNAVNSSTYIEFITDKTTFGIYLDVDLPTEVNKAVKDPKAFVFIYQKLILGLIKIQADAFSYEAGKMMNIGAGEIVVEVSDSKTTQVSIKPGISFDLKGEKYYPTTTFDVLSILAFKIPK